MDSAVDAAIQRLVMGSSSPSELKRRVVEAFGEGYLSNAYAFALEIKDTSWWEEPLSTSGAQPGFIAPSSESKGTRILKPTMVVLAIGAACTLLVVLFPPYIGVVGDKQLNLGFGSLFFPPHLLAHVNADLLAALVLSIGVLTGILWALARRVEIGARRVHHRPSRGEDEDVYNTPSLPTTSPGSRLPATSGDGLGRKPGGAGYVPNGYVGPPQSLWGRFRAELRDECALMPWWVRVVVLVFMVLLVVALI